jgi:hypothetical protein
MAARRKVGIEDEFSIGSLWYSDERNKEARTNTGIVPSSTPSQNQHLTPRLITNSSAAWATAAYLYLYLNLIGFDGV